MVKYNWLSQDSDGRFYVFVDKPVTDVSLANEHILRGEKPVGEWLSMKWILDGRPTDGSNYFMQLTITLAPNPDWENTLRYIGDNEDVYKKYVRSPRM